MNTLNFILEGLGVSQRMFSSPLESHNTVYVTDARGIPIQLQFCSSWVLGVPHIHVHKAGSVITEMIGIAMGIPCSVPGKCLWALST